jgi:hypothetical protein
MDAGAALLERARSLGCDSIAVVGTGKNVGKTVAVAAVCDALERRCERFGLFSIGRDGESADALIGTAKPRLFLRAGALIATARSRLPAGPAVEIVAQTSERSALGSILLARVRAAGFYEISGPPTAAGVHRVSQALRDCGAPFIVIDGAVDRLAALSGGCDAVVVATGAAGGGTIEQVARDAGALVARLSVPLFDPAQPLLRIEGALSAGEARALVEAGERRQIVVRDATRIAVSGPVFSELCARLNVRCERALRPVAATVASIGPERALEPRALLQAVARATGLPTYDVYAQACA